MRSAPGVNLRKNLDKSDLLYAAAVVQFLLQFTNDHIINKEHEGWKESEFFLRRFFSRPDQTLHFWMKYEQLEDWETLIQNKKSDLGIMLFRMRGKNDEYFEPIWLVGYDVLKKLIFVVDSSADMYE